MDSSTIADQIMVVMRYYELTFYHNKRINNLPLLSDFTCRTNCSIQNV